MVPLWLYLVVAAALFSIGMFGVLARRTGFHPVPPTVFRPRPRVDSAPVAFERIEAPAIAGVKPVVEAAFAHRRKTLANSLAGVGLASRAQAESALAAIGKSSRTRAEELDPAEFISLAAALERG